MTIELKPEQAQTIDEAIRAGLIKSAEDVVEAGLDALRERLHATPPAASSDEWVSKFRTWAHSRPTTSPLLSDQAISRARSTGSAASRWRSPSTPTSCYDPSSPTTHISPSSIGRWLSSAPKEKPFV